MTDELKRKFGRLRAVTPRLNKVTDEAARIVGIVEGELRENAAGIAAEADPFEETGSRREDEERCLTRRRLAYCRRGSSFAICVIEECHEVDRDGDWVADISRDVTPWAACDRATKLASFPSLLNLLEQIIERADRLSSSAEHAVEALAEMLGSSSPATAEPEEASVESEALPEGKQLSDRQRHVKFVRENERKADRQKKTADARLQKALFGKPESTPRPRPSATSDLEGSTEPAQAQGTGRTRSQRPSTRD